MTVIELSSLKNHFVIFASHQFTLLKRKQLRYTVNLTCPQEARNYFKIER